MAQEGRSDGIVAASVLVDLEKMEAVPVMRIPNVSGNAHDVSAGLRSWMSAPMRTTMSADHARDGGHLE